MRVRYEGGFLVQEALKEVILDPVRKTPGSVVSHGHMDHLTSGGIMTPRRSRSSMCAEAGRANRSRTARRSS